LGDTGDSGSRSINPHRAAAVSDRLAGVSAGNVPLKFLKRDRRHRRECEAPRDLGPPHLRKARKIATGLSQVYDRHFLRTLRAKARAKLLAYPGLFDAGRLERARSIYEFDDAVTAPVHGFLDAHDYYSRSSSLPWLQRIRRPTFLLSAVDDPFLPAAVLDDVRRVARDNPALTLEFTAHGGHVGFVTGRWPWSVSYYAERRACEFLAQSLR
jgi:predicted alpha/beta-fold hydrolase